MLVCDTISKLVSTQERLSILLCLTTVRQTCLAPICNLHSIQYSSAPASRDGCLSSCPRALICCSLDTKDQCDLIMAIWGDYCSHYRLVFLMMVLKSVALPLAIAAVICRIASWTHLFYSFFTYVLAIPMYWTILIQYDLYATQRDATRRGAILIPEVNGRWRGNIDLLFLRAFHFVQAMPRRNADTCSYSSPG